EGRPTCSVATTRRRCVRCATTSFRLGCPRRARPRHHRGRRPASGALAPHCEGGSMTLRTVVRGVVTLGAIALIAGRVHASDVIAVRDGGPLSGVVKAGAGAPAAGKIEVSKDPEVCGKEKPKPDMVVGAGGALANVVVVVKASKGKKLDLPATNPVFDQKTCEFHPHVFAFPAGSTIDVTNSDGILHNIHT